MNMIRAASITDKQCRPLIEKTRQLFNQLYLRLNLDGDDAFSRKLDLLNQKTCQLCLIAPLYDYSTELQANGYRSLIKIINQFTRKLIHRFHLYSTQYYKLSEKKQNVLINIVDLFTQLSELMLLLHSKTTLSTYTGDFTDVMYNDEETIDSIILDKLTHIDMKSLTDMIVELKPGFWLTSTLRVSLDLYSRAIAMYSPTTHDSLMINPFKLVSKKSVARANAKFSLYSNVIQMKSLWHLTGRKIAIPFVLASNSFEMPKIRKFISIKRKFTFCIRDNKVMFNQPTDDSPFCALCDKKLGTQCIHMSQEKKNDDSIDMKKSKQFSGKKDASSRLKMLLLHDNHFGKSPNDTVVLHLHGGGFVSMRPKGHEVYLRKWAKRLNGVPIIAPDYSLSPQVTYPTALEEVVEVYLFLIGFNFSILPSSMPLRNHSVSDVTVKDLIGFIPKNIILFGDSAGSNLSLSLLHVLSDLNKLLENNLPNLLMMNENGETINKLIRYPKALFQTYPYAGASLKTLTPSRILSPIDPILPFSVLWSLAEAYSPADGDHDSHSSSSSRAKNHCNNNNNMSSVAQNNATDESVKRKIRSKCNPWYSSNETRSKRLQQIDSFNLGRYFHPLTGSFDEFKSIPLFIQVCEFDPLLDEGIAVARKWKGQL